MPGQVPWPDERLEVDFLQVFDVLQNGFDLLTPRVCLGA